MRHVSIESQGLLFIADSIPRGSSGMKALRMLPSRGEGLGMVAVEAQAAGLPVLASNAVPRECVVMPELVRFQKVEAGEAAWAADLLQLAAQPKNILGANRRVTASAFSINSSAGALLRLYSEGTLS